MPVLHQCEGVIIQGQETRSPIKTKTIVYVHYQTWAKIFGCCCTVPIAFFYQPHSWISSCVQQLQHRSRSRNLHARLEVVRSFGADAATPRDIKECGRRPSRLRFTVRVPADCLIARSCMAVGLHSRAVWTRHATSRGRAPPPRERAALCRPRSTRRLTAAEVGHGDRTAGMAPWSPIFFILFACAAGTKHAPRELPCIVRSFPFLLHRPAETLHINHDLDRPSRREPEIMMHRCLSTPPL